ncbi:hypothetical protein AB0I84_08510 [Streptomyces spectabilis]
MSMIQSSKLTMDSSHSTETQGGKTDTSCRPSTVLRPPASACTK